MSNWLGILITVVYIFGLIATAELLRHRYGLSRNFTRNMIHIGVGMFSWVIPFLFTSPWPFIAGALAFSALTFLDWRFQIFDAMSSSNPNNLGTVYFPLIAALVVYFFWDNPPLMVAALMPLTWGDGLAPIIGKKFGRHHYRVMDSNRTLEGSLGFLAAAFLATWLALWIIPGVPELTPIQAILPALTVGIVTTLIEAVSVVGLDNITVTLAAGTVLNFWPY